MKRVGILFIILLIMTQNILGYNYYHKEYKWDNGVVKWWYNPSNSPMETEEIVAMLKKSAMKWQVISGLRFAYQGLTDKYIKDSADNQFVIGWGSKNDVLAVMKKNTYAAFVKRLGNNEGYMMLNYDRYNGVVGVGVKSWEGIITHEFGHVVGLYHSNVYESSMYYGFIGKYEDGTNKDGYRSSIYQETLRDDDINGIRSLYPLKTDVRCAGFEDFYISDNPNLCNEVENAILRGWVKGDSNSNTFRPYDAINRAEFSKVIARASRPQDESKWKKYDETCFSDVKQSQWFSKYVCFDKLSQIVKGYSDGTFKPTKVINFAEAAKIIVKSFAPEIQEGSGNTWYEPFVEKMKSIGIYMPNTDKELSQPVSRLNMIHMLYTADKLLCKAPNVYINLFMSQKTNNNITYYPSCENRWNHKVIQDDIKEYLTKEKSLERNNILLAQYYLERYSSLWGTGRSEYYRDNQGNLTSQNNAHQLLLNAYQVTTFDALFKVLYLDIDDNALWDKSNSYNVDSVVNYIESIKKKLYSETCKNITGGVSCELK